MGSNKSKFRSNHMLHYWKPGTSKMILYLPDAPPNENLFSYTILKDGKPYKLYDEKSLSIGDGKIIFVGGSRPKDATLTSKLNSEASVILIILKESFIGK